MIKILIILALCLFCFAGYTIKSLGVDLDIIIFGIVGYLLIKGEV